MKYDTAKLVQKSLTVWKDRLLLPWSNGKGKSLLSSKMGVRVPRAAQYSDIAQLVEQAAVNRLVVGSSPTVGASVCDHRNVLMCVSHQRSSQRECGVTCLREGQAISQLLDKLTARCRIRIPDVAQRYWVPVALREV